MYQIENEETSSKKISSWVKTSLFAALVLCIVLLHPSISLAAEAVAVESTATVESVVEETTVESLSEESDAPEEPTAGETEIIDEATDESVEETLVVDPAKIDALVDKPVSNETPLTAPATVETEDLDANPQPAPVTTTPEIPVKGLVSDENGLRYFDGTSATPYTNRWRTVDGKTYYFGADSYAVEGLQVDAENGAIYYFDIPTNVQYKERWRTVDGNTYYFNKNGVATRGELRLNDVLHFFGNDGVQFKNRWKTLDDKTYYFNANGTVTTGKLVLNDTLHYFDGEGVQFKNRWKTIDENTYYFNANGTVTTGLVTLNGATHFFGGDGVQFKNRWKTVEDGTYLFNANGTPTKGYFRESDSRISYYFDPTTGFQKKNQLVTNQSALYYANANGVLAEGWAKTSGATYYFNHVDNDAFRGLKNTGESVHYFESDGKLKSGNISYRGLSGYSKTYRLYEPTAQELSNAWLNHANLDERTKGRDILNYGLQYSGTRYVWDGIDLMRGVYCCGLQWAMMQEFGIEIPSIELGGGYDMVVHQYEMAEEYGGRYVKKDWNTLQAGDLVFSTTTASMRQGVIRHVSMFAGIINGVPYVYEAVGVRGAILQPASEVLSWGYYHLDQAVRYY